MLFRLLLIAVLIAGLLSAQEDSGDKRTKSELENYSIDTTLIEIFSTISKKYDTFLDLPPIPIFDELTDLDNENVNQVLESSERFNELVNKAQNILGSVEQSVKSSKDYDTCETDIVSTVCTYFRDKGDHSITVVQEITPHWITYKEYYSGRVLGVDSLPPVLFERLDLDFEMHLFRDQFMTRDGKRYLMQFYRPPSPPECDKERLFTVEKMIGDDETTIYTPWGTSSNQEIVYKSTFYHCLPFLGKKDSHPLSCNEMISKGNKLTFRISAWSYKNKQLYHFWVGIWDWGSRSGTWITFDEDGMVKNTGPM